MRERKEEEKSWQSEARVCGLDPGLLLPAQPLPPWVNTIGLSLSVFICQTKVGLVPSS